DRPDTRIAHVRAEAVQQLRRAGVILRVRLQPRIHVRPDQPRPHCTLVICRVARAKVAEVARLVVRLPRGERTQAHWRQEMLTRDREYRSPLLALEYRMIERNREDLIRP